MKFQYMGTAAAEGIPALFCECEVCARAEAAGGRNIRGRSGAMANGHVMLDFPPDMWHNKVRYGLNLAAVTDIFFTHSHIDHLAGNELCYIHPMYANRKAPEKALRLHGNARVLEVIRAAFAFDSGALPDCVSLHLLEAFAPVMAGDVVITPLPAVHDKREACMVFLLESGGKRLLYANDTAMLPEETFAYLHGKRLDVASLDCTAARQPGMRSHMGFAENLAARERLISIGAADVQTLFISNHFSHNGLVNYDDFAALAEGTGFISSYDGMELAL